MLIKPEEEQVKQALVCAEQMRNRGDDPDFVAHTLLYYQHRLELLEKVFEYAELYLHFGLTPEHHRQLAKAVDNVRKDKEVLPRENGPTFGLE